jgi:hypothetical protein
MGEHRLDVPSLLLQQLLGGPRVEFLDHLIARSTRIDPGSRPTMAEFARELRAWLAPKPSARPADDVSQVAKRLDVLMAAPRREQLDRHRQQQQFRAALDVVERGLAPIRERLGEQGIEEAVLSTRNSSALESAPRDRPRGSSGIVDTDGVSVLLQMPGGDDPTLWSGVGLQLFDDGTLHIVASHRIRLPGYERGKSLWHRDVSVHVGSAVAESELPQLLQDLESQMPAAIAQYVEAVRAAQRAPLPLPRSGLSPLAQRLAAFLSTESGDAIVDLHFDIALLMDRLDASERDLVDAANELERRGWVALLEDGNAPLGCRGVMPKADLFLDTEPELHGANVELDSIRFIIDAVDAGQDSLQVRERASALGWNPRRANIACYFLVSHSAVDREFQSQTDPYFYDGFWLGSVSRDFVRRHR